MGFQWMRAGEVARWTVISPRYIQNSPMEPGGDEAVGLARGGATVVRMPPDLYWRWSYRPLAPPFKAGPCLVQ